MAEPDKRAVDLVAEADMLKTEMMMFQSLWQDCADHAMPLRRMGFNKAGSAPFMPDPRLQSDVAVDALNTLASGMLSWVTPSQENWFTWNPADGLPKSEAVSDWLEECTKRAHAALANSNFYGAMQLEFMELGSFGTGAVYCEAGKKQALNFRTWRCGTFACAEDDQGNVERIFRWFTLTAGQAIERWGKDAPKQCHEDVELNKRHTPHEFLHAIYPREMKGRRKGGPLGMPVASCYLYPRDKKIVREEGYSSMPAMVARWLKWSDESPYGVSPAMMAIADIRGSNYLETNLGAIANLKINPRIITQTDMVGVVDLGPGGITQVKSMGEKPEVWADPGDYRIGLDLIDRVDSRIGRAFHTPLFEMFTRMDDKTTATLTRARAREQVGRITPAFTLLTTDLVNPTLERVFMVMFEGGHFPPPPQEAFVEDKAGQWLLPYPKVVQLSRMAQAVEEVKAHAFAGTIEMFWPLITGTNPEIMDNFDVDAAARSIARGNGVPKEMLRSEEDRDELRAARAQAQQQQAALEFASKQPDAAMAAANVATGGADEA